MNIQQKMNREFQQEAYKQVQMIYPVVIHVLYHEFGWKKLRILRLLSLNQSIWQECASYGTDKSMLSMLEEETGIEMRNSEKKSYHDYAYLNSNIWDGKPPTEMQLIYIRKQQIQWLPQIYLASFGIALHRKEKYGYERIARFINLVQEIRFERGTKLKNYRGLIDGTGFTEEELFKMIKGEDN